MARTNGNKAPQKGSVKDNGKTISEKQGMGPSVLNKRNKTKKLSKMAQDKGKAKAKVSLASRKKIDKRKGKGKKTMTRRQQIQAFKESYGDMTRSDVIKWRGPKPRSNSQGLFAAAFPAHPTRIDISNGIIKNNCAKKTILGAIRAFWPVGSYTWTDLEDTHPDFPEKVWDNFKSYFKHLKGQSRSQSKAIVIDYIQAVCKRTLYEEKVRTCEKARTTGKSYLELCPSYYNIEFWKGLIEFWRSEEHQERSRVGIENRGKVTNLHSSGARPFQEVAEIMQVEKAGKKPTRLELWNRTHTRAGTELDENGNPKQYTTAAAMEIATRYASILDDKGVDQTLLDESLEPFDWWLQATAPGLSKPKKGKLIGYPRVPARKLLGDLANNHQKRIAKNPSSSLEGSSSSAAHKMPNDTFVKVVSGVLDYLKNNPESYQRELNDEQIESLTEAALSLGDPAARSQFSQLISQEAVHVVKEIVTDMFEKYKTAVAEEGGSEALDESDYTDESDQDNDANCNDGEKNDGEANGSEEIVEEDIGDGDSVASGQDA